jgi:hypothetical protein
MGENMELTVEEREMLQKIVSNQYTGGGHKRSTWIEPICRTGADQTVLAALCQKGLVETGLGRTVG